MVSVVLMNTAKLKSAIASSGQFYFKKAFVKGFLSFYGARCSKLNDANIPIIISLSLFVLFVSLLAYHFRFEMQLRESRCSFGRRANLNLHHQQPQTTILVRTELTKPQPDTY